MSDPAATFIARHKTCADWWLFRRRVVVGGAPGPWQAAFEEYFVGRLKDRYLDPIKTLQSRGCWLGEGFSIVAIQCSLIEFLESTLQGKNYRYLKKGEKLGPDEYSRSRDVFVAFLCNRHPFKNVFQQQLAEEVYASIRCGILHEARTKNGWLIHAGTSQPAMIDPAKHVFYRDKVQEGLLDFIAWYGQALPSHTGFQEAFLRKYDHLCQ